MKNLRNLTFLLVLFCSLLSYGFVGDDDPLTAFLAKIERYRDSHFQEKVHIHTDKPYYAIGDTIWLKSYVVRAENNQLSTLSKFLYVELINEKDSIKSTLRLPLTDGLAWGDFALADSLSEGNYRIRAYTTWMRNFDESYFFDKTILIGNSLSSQVISNVNYKYSKTGVKENVNADVRYTTLEGEPLKGKDVSYDIELDSRNILKGTGKTDSSGSLKINFTNAQPFVLKSGKINTRLKMDEKTVVKKSFLVKTTSNDTDVQFFPESGSLITNIRSRVAFKALGSDGLGRTVSGYILNKASKNVANFNSAHAGMGSFVFTPLQGESYTAVIVFEDGSEKRVVMPPAADSGYMISVSDLDNDITLRVAAVSSSEPELILVGQSNGVVHYVSKAKPENGFMSARLSKKRFPSGIIHFTLFNASYKPVAERLAFILHKPALEVKAATDKASYSTREKVKMTLDAIDSAGKAVQGSFSVSVIDESKIPFDDTKETTILSNLLLSSDLKGYIERPNYYFTEVTSKKLQELDNLMLTQGWRKFDWADITSSKLPVLAFSPERSLSVSGKVLNLNSTPVIKGKVTLFSASGTGMVGETLTDNEGKFLFDSLSFNDSTTIVIQARNPKGKNNVEIRLDRLPPQLVPKSQNRADAEINVNQVLLPYITLRDAQFDEMRKKGMLRRSILLEEVKISEKKPRVKFSNNLNGPGNADAVLTAADLKNCFNLVFCLQGRVSGLIMQNGVPYLNRNRNFGGLVPMNIIVDGMSLMDASFLSTLMPGDIESIEVLKSAGYTAIYGLNGGGGVLVITTKRGEANFSPRGFVPGVTSFKPLGVYNARTFYAPKYAAPTATLPDWRSTIHWAPNIITSSEGKASFEFYTADKPGTYKAVIEGLDLNGGITRQVYRFSVK